MAILAAVRFQSQQSGLDLPEDYPPHFHKPGITPFRVIFQNPRNSGRLSSRTWSHSASGFRYCASGFRFLKL
jgi:hypothetical protein